MITGSIVAMVTPMKSGRLEVDWSALRALVDWHLEQGTAAIVAVGTTGESATLTVAEHARVITEVVKQAAGRIPVIAGTGANATAEAIELTEAAAEAGADAALLVTPYYNKPTQAGLIAHYMAIARAVPLPQILYNVPGRTACDMLPETVIELSVIDNIVGVKEATGDLARARHLIAHCPADFAIYSGDDPTARELMLAGGHGDISVTANVAPALMAAMCSCALAGDRQLAEQLDAKLAELHRTLFLEANPIPVKWAVARLGWCEPVLRLPMTPFSPQFHADVEQAMRGAGINLG